MTDFTDALKRLQDTNPELFLGRICWYVITEQSGIDHTDFCQRLLGAGFESLPPTPRSSDVFKRACTAAQRKNVPVTLPDGTVDPNKTLNILIREVGKDTNNIWRNVVVETVDKSGHTLDYVEAAELHYHRPSKVIKTKFAVGSPEVTNVVEEVQRLHKEWDNMLTPYAVRELIRKLIRNLQATVLRDGVYFVREEHAARVDALDEIVNGLGNGSMFHSLPLLDDRKQREMLRQAFEDESIGEIDRILGEVREIMQSKRKVTSDRFADFKVQYDTLRKKVADYSDLLDEAMVSTASRLEVMDQVLFELMGRIKV